MPLAVAGAAVAAPSAVFGVTCRVASACAPANPYPDPDPDPDPDIQQIWGNSFIQPLNGGI
jgi:hypothetical protein